MRFKVGEKVKTRDWEELSEKYGESSGLINMPLGFTQEMDEALRDKELEISSIVEDRVIFVNGYPQFNLTEDMLRYPDEEVNYYRKWEVKASIDSYREAENFYDDSYDRCAIKEFDLLPEINQEYAWDLLMNLYLPAKCTVEYLESDEYQKFKEIRYGLIGRSMVCGDDADENHINFLTMLSTVHNVYDTLFLVKGKPDDEIRDFLIDREYIPVEITQDYWETIKANDSYTFEVYKQEKDGLKRAIVFSEVWDNEVLRSLYLTLAQIWNCYMSPELMKGILGKDQKQMYAAIQKCFTEFEEAKKQLEIFRNIKKLSGFFEEQQNAMVKDQINRLARDIKSLEEEIIEKQRKKRDYQLRAIGLKNVGYEDNLQMFLQYTDSIKDKITYLNVGENRITGAFYLPLTYWSEEEWGAVSERYSRTTNGHLLKDIFENKKYTLYFEQGFIMDFSGNCSVKRYDYAGEKGIPNPHMQRYDCWGDNYRLIVDNMLNFDLTMAVGQIMSAISGINVSDTPVFDQLRSYLNDRRYENIPCFKNNETGEFISIKQYYEMEGE